MHTITLTGLDFVVVAGEFVVQIEEEVSGFVVIRIGISAAVLAMLSNWGCVAGMMAGITGDVG